MGFCGSKHIPEQLTQPEPEPEPTSDTDDENSSDDYLMDIEDISTDVVQLPKTLHHYPSPISTENEYRQPWGAPIKWFSDWIPSSNDYVIVKKTRRRSIDSETLSQKDVDERAKKAPSPFIGSFTELVQYLTEGLRNSEREQKLKVRALIVWLSNQDVDSRKKNPGSPDNPEGFLALLGQRKSTYATLFTLLCRTANIPCVLVEGICKAGKFYQPGSTDTEKIKCVWTVVYTKTHWNIIHPLWICRIIVGHKTGSWIKLEAGGKSVGKQEKATEGVIQNAFKEYYFLTDPNEFIYYCHPNDKHWQLIERHILQEHFLKQENIFPTFFGLGLKLLSEKSCILQSCEGKVKIELESPMKNANAIDMCYDFYFRDENDEITNGHFLLKPENMPKLVAMIRYGEKWTFDVQFPLEGTYKLCLFGSPHKSTLLRVAEFRIDCSKKKENCIPLPIDPGIIGFGPGPAAEDAGLRLPSHKNGIYPVRKNDIFKARFRLEPEIAETSTFESGMHRTIIHENGIVKNEDLTRLIKSEIFRKRMELEVSAEIPDNGEYALTISTVNASERSPVCNYLLTSNLPQTYEDANKRFARRRLQNAMVEDAENGEFEDRANIIQNAITKCLREKIREKDEEIEFARIRVEYLMARKDIHDALLRRHVEVASKTLSSLQQSRFAFTFRRQISKLAALCEELIKENREHEGTVVISNVSGP